MIYKIFSILSHDAHDVNNDSIDLHVITEEGKVFFATFITRANISEIMTQQGLTHLWIEDMVIVEDIHIETIKNAVVAIIKDLILDRAFSEIGDIKKIYGPDRDFLTLKAREGSVSMIIEV